MKRAGLLKQISYLGEKTEDHSLLCVPDPDRCDRFGWDASQ